MPNRKKHAGESVMPWRTSNQIRGVRALLMVAIRTSEDGAHAMVDLKNAQNLIEICDQAMRTEQGRGT